MKKIFRQKITKWRQKNYLGFKAQALKYIKGNLEGL